MAKKKKVNFEYIWKDRKRVLGMPLSFTPYSMTEDRLFISVGFFTLKDDEVLLYRVRVGEIMGEMDNDDDLDAYDN